MQLGEDTGYYEDAPFFLSFAPQVTMCVPYKTGSVIPAVGGAAHPGGQAHPHLQAVQQVSDGKGRLGRD